MPDRRDYDPFSPHATPDPHPARPEGDLVAPLPDDLDDITLKDLKARAELAGVATWGSKHDIAHRLDPDRFPED